MRRWALFLALLTAFSCAAGSAQAEPISLALAAGFVSIGVGAPTAAILAQITLFAVGVGISFASQALFAPPQPKPSDGQVIIKQATAPRFRAYGKVKTGGVLMFMNTQAGILHRVIAMGQGELDAVEEHWIDDNLVAVAGDGTVTTPPYMLGGFSKVRLEWQLGDTTGGYRYLLLESIFPTLWTADHLGKGIASAYMLMHQVPQENQNDVWPNGGNTLYRQVQRGAKVPGVDSGALTAPEWSDSAARIILDYLIHPDGLRLDPSWIENAIEDWFTAIAVCGEPVDGAARWRIWNTYRFDERPADVLARFCDACDATLFATPGQGLAIKVGRWETPTVLIDDDAIIAFSDIRRGGDLLTSTNTIRARYTEPTQDYQETDAVPWVDDADVTARGEFPVDFDFFPAPSHSQCRRLMKIQASRLNPVWSGTFVCNLRALPVLGERFILVQCNELGIAASAEVEETQLIVEGTILTGVQIKWHSMPEEAWDWDGSGLREGGLAAPRVVPPIEPDNTLPLPTGLAVALSGSRAVLTWDPPPEPYLQVDARWKPTSAAEWLLIPVAPGALATAVDGLASGVEYTFQIRHRSTPTARVTDWDAASATATPSYPDDGSAYRRIEA